MVINAVLFCAFQHSSLQIDKIHLQIVLFEERHIAADFLFFFVSLQAEQIKLYACILLEEKSTTVYHITLAHDN